MISPALRTDLNGVQVLVVDDNALNVLIAKKLLLRWNATVETAEDGAIAVDKARRTPFDLVLMDIQMPNIDGYTAGRMIRTFDEHVVIMAMSADELDMTYLHSLGINGFVLKPFEPNYLLSQLQRALDA